MKLKCSFLVMALYSGHIGRGGGRGVKESIRKDWMKTTGFNEKRQLREGSCDFYFY
jgi:hypothetical protein